MEQCLIVVFLLSVWTESTIPTLKMPTRNKRIINVFEPWSETGFYYIGGNDEGGMRNGSIANFISSSHDESEFEVEKAEGITVNVVKTNIINRL